MSLRRVESELIPSATAEAAQVAFPKGSLAIRIRDELGALFADEDFAEASGLARHRRRAMTRPPLTRESSGRSASGLTTNPGPLGPGAR